ncbi:c-type cytochrome biogenesis protein CcmI [Roseitranquillus sediminis]|uniref:c-type cytochrome biogenesis protein CcmI n=1 Tax=Roseitranquillus sediminis TaxID=2809051 RepID=UPI001D0C428E|nr:c-type cytochrome biogenesis protein CcmI [Roseitranquillus sediminis]MBM9594318.1 c-type cytochrome biogenesis protein CcmI [Roseitranquillus sediminis]
MAFWITALAMAAAVAALLLRAFWSDAGAPNEATDVDVYRDQLKEVDRDVARSVLTEDEAARIRLEVSRRLLDADRRAASGGASDGAPKAASAGVAFTLALLVLGGGVGLYVWLGAPGYPDLPIAARREAAEVARAERPSQALAEAEAAVAMPAVEGDPRHAALMEQLRQTLQERSDDLQGYVLLARNEAILGNYAAAHRAQARVIELKGQEATAADWSDYADLLVMAAGGYVSHEAERALAEALRRDPANGTARYYSGLLYAQTGRPDLAFQVWRPLVEQGPGDAPWVQAARAQIGRAAQLAGVRYDPPAAPGPSAADLAAAQEMSPEERQEMVRGMVEGLSQRLATEGGPAEDWARLIAALGVLGEQDRAAAIYAEARSAFGTEAESLGLIDEAAERAGIAR